MGTLIDEASEAVKHEIKNPDGEFLGVLLESSDAYMLGNMLTRKVVMRAGKGFMRARKYIYIYIYIYIIIWIIWFTWKLSFMVFFQKIIYLNKRWNVCLKSQWQMHLSNALFFIIY